MQDTDIVLYVCNHDREGLPFNNHQRERERERESDFFAVVEKNNLSRENNMRTEDVSAALK